MICLEAAWILSLQAMRLKKPMDKGLQSMCLVDCHSVRLAEVSHE